MKILILAIGMVTSQAFACVVPEAQFIGHVKNFNVQQRSESVQECFYEINFSSFNSSVVCPLEIDEAISAKFQDYNCELKDGDMVSGYLSKINDKIILQ